MLAYTELLYTKQLSRCLPGGKDIQAETKKVRITNHIFVNPLSLTFPLLQSVASWHLCPVSQRERRKDIHQLREGKQHARRNVDLRKTWMVGGTR